jgi:hypothetical protein
MRVCRVCAVLFITIGMGARASAQIQYASGQNVAPVFEGWEHNPDGTYNMVFGYLNRNYEEQVDVPIGANNTIIMKGESLGDRGQPTHFYTRRQRFIFRVVVPADWDKKEKVVWSLTSAGHTDQAKGWLQPEWELSDSVITENMGGGISDPDNKAPAVTIKPVETVSVGDAATLTVTATDDGLPKPIKRNPGNVATAAEPPRPQGVQIKWIQYRGPGKVTFSPDASPVIHGQPITLTSKAKFSVPGTYVLRATASDGQLFTTRDVTVNVKP